MTTNRRKSRSIVPLIAAGLVTFAAAIAPVAGHAQDATKGEKVFRKCKACHQVGEKARKTTGPILNGVVGREVAGFEGFKYSDALASSGLLWDEETLATFLKKPKDLVPGTKMTFAGLKKEADIVNLIAFLATFNADGTTN